MSVSGGLGAEDLGRLSVGGTELPEDERQPVNTEGFQTAEHSCRKMGTCLKQAPGYTGRPHKHLKFQDCLSRMLLKI